MEIILVYYYMLCKEESSDVARCEIGMISTAVHDEDSHQGKHGSGGCISGVLLSNFVNMEIIIVYHNILRFFLFFLKELIYGNFLVYHFR